MSVLCRLGFHAGPYFDERDGWPYPVLVVCRRCGGTFTDYGPAH